MQSSKLIHPVLPIRPAPNLGWGWLVRTRLNLTNDTIFYRLIYR
jgi:hypothetical protein